MSFDPGNRLIIALDVPDPNAADALVERLDGAASWLKIGLELFIAAGPQLVRRYTDRGYNIMLDLKLHDIPVTVERAVARAVDMGVGLLTVHAGGGPAMLSAAADAARKGSGDKARILAVTVLTSMDASDLTAVGIGENISALVAKRAQIAVEAGCGGVVASPLEAADLRAAVPDRFLIVTPGVRPAGGDVGDQKRVMTPAKARAAGADLLVVGRPVRDAQDPAAAAREIVAEIASANG